MTHYALAIAWTLALTLAFAGWGAVVGRALLGRGAGDLGERIAWGIALTVALAGVANLSRAISPGLAVGYTAAGVVAFGIDAARRRGGNRPGLAIPSGRAGRVLLAGALALGAVRLLDAAHASALERFDDHMGYLVFPVEMLQTGGMTRDPFNNRRLVASLGGMSALNALGLAALPVEDLKAVDLGVGLLGVLAAAVGLTRPLDRIGWAWLGGVYLVLLDRPLSTNLTALLIPTALLLAIHRTLGRDERSMGRAAMLGLLASGLVALKSSLIPIAAFVFAIDLLPRVARGSAWRALAIEAVVGLACLAPWMIALEESSGTYLYPILGRGVDGTRYGTYARPNEAFTPAFVRRNAYLTLTDPQAAAALAFGAAGLACWARRAGRRPEDLAMLVAPLPSLLVMAGLFDRTLAVRYAAPILPASMVVSLAAILRRSDDPRRETRNALLGLACLAFFAGARWTETRAFFESAARDLAHGASGRPYVAPAEAAAYAALQAAVPPGEPILVHLARPFLLDFRRNPIGVADWPGGASPPPGLPSFRGPEPLAAYLLGLGIRRVAYSYDDRSGFPDEALADDASSTWVRSVFRHRRDFLDNLDALRASRRLDHDDGSRAVIDLVSPRPGPGQPPR